METGQPLPSLSIRPGRAASHTPPSQSSNRSVNTIEANPSSLNVKKFDLEFDVDPLFRMVGPVRALLHLQRSPTPPPPPPPDFGGL